MIAIRLSRFGRKNAPFYRVVAVDSSKKVKGQVLATLGTWNIAKKKLEVDRDKIKDWVKKGAQVSRAVKKLLEK